MKLRALTLTNIRRFAGQSATIDAIGDGITVLSEPNEFGKSTFFDALHAVFFERHRGKSKSVLSLQPHAGGAPEATVDIETAAGLFRIEKRWLVRPFARVTTSDGRVIAQDDEAEAWIDGLFAGGLAGPTGLLWVRQGMVALEPDGGSAADKAERERLLGLRRDLLSSVAGEIDAMTGGRRMDAVMARVVDGLAALATQALAPKKGGPWFAAVEEANDLAARAADLARKATALSDALAARRDVERRLQALLDPDEANRRSAALTAARMSHQAALEHDGRLVQARQTLNLAELTVVAARTDLAALAGLADGLAQAEAAHAEAQRAAGEALPAAATARKDEAAAAQAAGTALRRATELRDRLRAAQRLQLAQSAAQRAAEMAARLDRAEGLRAEAAAALALAAAQRITPQQLAVAEAAQTDCAAIAARIAAQAVTLRFAYDGTRRAEAGGRTLDEGETLRLTAPGVITLAGFGRIEVDPGAAQDGDLTARAAAADADLARALAACDAATLHEAREKHAAAVAARDRARRAGDVLGAVLPEGFDALHEALAKARADAGTGLGAGAGVGSGTGNGAGSGTDTDTQKGTGASTAPEDIAALEQALAQAEEAEARARGHAESLRAAVAGLAQNSARAEAVAAAALRSLERARAAAGDPADLADRTRHAQAAAATAEAAVRPAAAAVRSLVDHAPDLVTRAAALDRAESAVAQAAQERARLSADAAELAGFIRSQADLGIEEDLERVRGEAAMAQARATRFGTEVRALHRLKQALDAARRAARDAYFEPVLAELRPLLAILHGPSDLGLDDRSLLPARLLRGGLAEDLDSLSGGTREQIAILTRLAFARLFARRGSPVPVILDDALVHSDDDRIEAMFVALHRIARDQQILVFTCRQRAFAALGGDRAVVRIAARG